MDCREDTVQFSQAIRVWADVSEELMDLNEFEVAVLAAGVVSNG